MIDLDWSQVDREIADELFRPLSDTRIPSVRLAQELEHKMFTFMLMNGISKVYTWTESEVHDNIFRETMRFDDVRPLGTECTEYDFNNLLSCELLSDSVREEFSALPPSPNTGLVKS